MQLSINKVSLDIKQVIDVTLCPFLYLQLQAYRYIGLGNASTQIRMLPISLHKNVLHFVPGEKNEKYVNEYQNVLLTQNTFNKIT